MRPSLYPLAIALTAASAHAQLPVVGVVRDSAGTPLSAVEVSIANRTATTGANGSFTVTGVTGDPVTIRFRKVGFEPLTVRTARDSASPAAPLSVHMGPLIARLGRVIVKGRAYDQKL